MFLYETLLEGVQNSVKKYPNNIALTDNEANYTYEEIYEIAKAHAQSLIVNNNKERLKKVAIFSHRHPASFIGLLIAFLSGATYIPLNPKFPIKRNLSILDQTQPDAVITDSKSIKSLSEILESYKLKTPQVTIVDPSNSHLEELHNTTTVSFSFPKIGPEDIAYILFTSGSTGLPKGVPISHRNVCSFLKYNQKRYSIDHLDRFSQTFDLTFDLSVFDVFMAWCSGACLCIMRSIDMISPSKYINENRLTIWFSVPSVISLLKKRGGLDKAFFPSLRLSLFCGEPLLEKQMISWQLAAPNSMCENLYGPTELTIACTAYSWSKLIEKNHINNGIVSIGTPYNHMKWILLDKNNNLAEEEGELCISGSQMFKGYFGFPKNEQTSYFYELENETGIKEIYYKTGDRVKLGPDKNFMFLGRTDYQVKINGYRVELSEIESFFNSIHSVERAIAICVEEPEENKLVLFVVGSGTQEKLILEAQKALPYYMVPKEIQFGLELPLSANKKIDRKAIRLLFANTTT